MKLGRSDKAVLGVGAAGFAVFGEHVAVTMGRSTPSQ
jgi:hypothetical protein